MKKGFTLIELLVVVAIIAILALIALLAINPVELARRSRDSRRLSDLGTIRRSIDLALADGQSLHAAGPLTLTPAVSTTNFDGAGLDISKYLSVVPQDPSTGVASQYIQASDCTGVASSALKYEYKSDGNNYVLRSQVESADNCNAIKNDGNSDNYFETGTDPGLNLF